MIFNFLNMILPGLADHGDSLREFTKNNALFM